jgi:hypothetical protein
MITRRQLGFLTRLAIGPRPARAVPPRHRSARRAVLWGAGVVVLAHLGLAALMETVLPQLRDPEYGYRLVRAREQQRLHPDRPFVLVLGTSRTANGFDPTAAGIPDELGAPILFNCGLSGSGPVQLRAHLARLRADGLKPDVVLVEVFPVMLVIDRPDDIECSLFRPKLTAGDLRRLNPADPLAFYARWTADRLNAWHAQRIVIVSHLAPDWLPWGPRLDHYWKSVDRFGFSPYPVNKVDEHRESRLATTRAAYAKTAGELRVGEASDRAWRALVADCRSAGTPVAFFIMPESPAFRRWYTPESRAVLAAYTRVLTDELGCPVFLPPDDFAEGDFADGHHMLPTAAGRFTRHLTERHIKPWLATVRK